MEEVLKVSMEDYEKYCRKCCFCMEILSKLPYDVLPSKRSKMTVQIRCGTRNPAELPYVRKCDVKNVPV